MMTRRTFTTGAAAGLAALALPAPARAARPVVAVFKDPT
jgi:hypothetical protein